MSDLEAIDQSPMLTPDDVATRLTVSRSMVYALIKTGKLRVIYIGRLPRILESDLADYLARSATNAAPPRRTRAEIQAATAARKLTAQQAISRPVSPEERNR